MGRVNPLQVNGSKERPKRTDWKLGEKPPGKWVVWVVWLSGAFGRG